MFKCILSLWGILFYCKFYYLVVKVQTFPLLPPPPIEPLLPAPVPSPDLYLLLLFYMINVDIINLFPFIEYNSNKLSLLVLSLVFPCTPYQTIKSTLITRGFSYPFLNQSFIYWTLMLCLMPCWDLWETQIYSNHGTSFADIILIKTIRKWLNIKLGGTYHEGE